MASGGPELSAVLRELKEAAEEDVLEKEKGKRAKVKAGKREAASRSGPAPLDGEAGESSGLLVSKRVCLGHSVWSH